MHKTPNRHALKRMFVLLSVLPESNHHAAGAVTRLTHRIRQMGIHATSRTIRRDLAFFESQGWAARASYAGSEERWRVLNRLNMTPHLRPVAEPKRPPDIFNEPDDSDIVDEATAVCKENAY